jgi:nucleoside-diphosphate-sugar epimerase
LKHAIVTGAAGFLGFCLARQLAARPDVRVTCVDNFSRGARDEAWETLGRQPNVTLIEADLTDRAAVAALPTDADVVFHMAALNGTQNFYERPFEVVRSCTLPTIYLVEHFGAAGAKPRFVYAGTSEAYAASVTKFGWPIPTAEDVPLSIDDPYNARWSYGASKLHGEIATINGCRHFGMPFTIVRYHNAYGPRMGDKHVIPDFLMRAKQGEYSLYGGADTRSFLYGDDACAATIALAEAAAAENDTFHVGGQRELTMVDLAKLMMQVCGMEGELVVHPAPAGSVARRCPDVAKATGVIGPFETISLEEGLRRTADWYLA